MNRLSPLLAAAALTLSLPAFAQTAPASIPPDFTQCLDGLRDEARRNGVSETTYRFLTRDLAPDMSCRDFTRLFRLPHVRRAGRAFESPLVDLSRMRPRADIRPHPKAQPGGAGHRSAA